jgi:hypothetical protein
MKKICGKYWIPPSKPTDALSIQVGTEKQKKGESLLKETLTEISQCLKRDVSLKFHNPNVPIVDYRVFIDKDCN